MLLGDCERLGNAACGRSLEPEPIIGKRSRISDGLPSGACWPALFRLTPVGVGFCNRRGAAVWPAPARRLLRLLKGDRVGVFGPGSCFGRVASRDPASARRRRLPLAPRCGHVGEAARPGREVGSRRPPDRATRASAQPGQLRRVLSVASSHAETANGHIGGPIERPAGGAASCTVGRLSWLVRAKYAFAACELRESGACGVPFVRARSKRSAPLSGAGSEALISPRPPV
jgi:hypothetical protein